MFRSSDSIAEDETSGNEDELRLQLEVSENETAVLRKKVEGLLTDNLKLTKEIKDLNSALKNSSKTSKIQVRKR